MKLRNPRLIRIVAVAAAWLIRIWMSTVRYRLINLDSSPHPADADEACFIYAFWHEALLAPVRYRARVRVLISKHADGELIARAAQALGFGVVRGSTTRGGGEALVELWHCSNAAHLIFTPDGPRGPRRTVQPGMLMLASRSGLPIVPVGVAYTRCWRFKSWDRFALPLPFCQCLFVASEAIQVPPDADRKSLDEYRRLVEQRMNEATELAEHYARVGGGVKSLRAVAPGAGLSGPSPHFGRRATEAVDRRDT
ncbi:MAG: lysophospholipid acyltransferase family protein [Isosphaeraceae bacterium]